MGPRVPRRSCILAGLLTLVSLSVLPSERIAEPVLERQAMMKEMAAAARTIAILFKGGEPFDRAAFQTAARTLVTHSGPVLSNKFPAGTLGGSSAALDTIASERQTFEKIADRLHTLAGAFENKATAATTGISPAMRMREGDLMGGGSLLGARKRDTEEDLSEMPAEHVFHEMLDTCTQCHGRFRRHVD